MKIVPASFEEIIENRLFQKIELCGRVCYKSEDKITETSAQTFVKKICVNNHGSVLEHYAFCFEVSEKYFCLLKEADIPFFTLTNFDKYLVSFNLRAYINASRDAKYQTILRDIMIYMGKTYPDLFDTINEDSVNEIKFIDNYDDLNEKEYDVHKRISIKITTDRGVTHELVRHRLASFSQESTRYCNYAKDKFGNEITVIEPVGLNEGMREAWIKGIEACEKAYFEMLENGATPQIARSVLPNSLKTEICITASIEEWKLIFDLRCPPQAHPDCRAIMNPIKDYFIMKGYIR